MRNQRIKRSRAQERRGQKTFGGSQNAGSGNGWARKADRRGAANQLVEYKRTDNAKQITIKADDLEQNHVHAWAEGRIPVLGFELRGKHYVIQEEADYLELVERAEANDGAGATGVVAPGEVPGP